MTRNINVQDWAELNINEPTYPPIDKEVVDLIKSYGKSKALILNINKYAFAQLETAFHESFHVFYQTDSHMPPWWNHIDRENLSKTCYFDYGEKYKLEGHLLIAAYDLLIGGHVDPAKQLLALYVNSRKERYNALKGKYVIDNDKSYTCPEAETNMEFLEGQAQFFGERGVIELGLIGRYKIASDYSYSLNGTEKGWMEPFYQFGSLQLHIIRLLDQDNFNKWTLNHYLSTNYSEAQLFKKIETLL